jgi:hypothetical protein
LRSFGHIVLILRLIERAQDDRDTIITLAEIAGWVSLSVRAHPVMVIYATMKAKPKKRLKGRTMKTDHKNSAMETSKMSNINIRKNDRLAFKLIPIGTFAGTIERVCPRSERWDPSSDTGDQGSSQN